MIKEEVEAEMLKNTTLGATSNKAGKEKEPTRQLNYIDLSARYSSLALTQCQYSNDMI